MPMNLSLGLGLGGIPVDEGVGVVYLADFATANDDSTDYHDQIAAAFDAGKEVRIRSGEWFNLETTLTTPENSRLRCEDPESGGFWLNMATGDGIVLGDGSRVSGLGAKSTAYPSADIAFDDNYVLHARGIKSGNNCWFDDVYMSDLAGGLQIVGKSDVTLRNINGSALRSRSGWTSVVYLATASNVVGVGIYGTNCDRFTEVEISSHDWSFSTGTATNIYPNGYGGQPGAEAGTEVYANYSFILDAHTHTGEGGNYNGSYTNFTITNCLGAIMSQRSTGSNLSDLSHDITWSNITINTPRTYNPVDLQGYNLTVNGLTFGGTRNGSLSRLIFTRSATGSANILVTNVTIPDNYYAQPVTQFQGAGSSLTHANVGTRAGPGVGGTSNAFVVFQAAANDCGFDNVFCKQPTYSTTVYSFGADTTGCFRTNTTYTDAPANDVGGAVNYNSTTVTESNNQDGIAA